MPIYVPSKYTEQFFGASTYTEFDVVVEAPVVVDELPLTVVADVEFWIAADSFDTTSGAADEAAAKTEAAAQDVKNASKEATAHVAGAVEQGAADVKEKAQQ